MKCQAIGSEGWKMLILDVLFGHVPRPDDPVPDIGQVRLAPRRSPETAQLGKSPYPTLLIYHTHKGQDSEPYSDTGPIFCMIEYLDERNRCTRHRVTARRIIDNNGIHYLIASCHETGTIRNFRMDRILYFITMDGEVVEPAEFQNDFLLVEPPPSQFTPDDSERLASREFEIRIRPAVTLIIAAAGPDYALNLDAIRTILHFCQNEVREHRRAGVLPTDPAPTAIDRVLRRVATLRPDRLAVVQAFSDLIRQQDIDAAKRCFRTLLDVVEDQRPANLDREAAFDDLMARICNGETRFRNLANDWIWS